MTFSKNFNKKMTGIKKFLLETEKDCYIIKHVSGHLAQLGEHLLDVEGVRGSSPLVSTIRNGKPYDK